MNRLDALFWSWKLWEKIVTLQKSSRHRKIDKDDAYTALKAEHPINIYHFFSHNRCPCCTYLKLNDEERKSSEWCTICPGAPIWGKLIGFACEKKDSPYQRWQSSDIYLFDEEPNYDIHKHALEISKGFKKLYEMEFELKNQKYEV